MSSLTNSLKFVTNVGRIREKGICEKVKFASLQSGAEKLTNFCFIP